MGKYKNVLFLSTYFVEKELFRILLFQVECEDSEKWDSTVADDTDRVRTFPILSTNFISSGLLTLSRYLDIW